MGQVFDIAVLFFIKDMTRADILTIANFKIRLRLVRNRHFDIVKDGGFQRKNHIERNGRDVAPLPLFPLLRKKDILFSRYDIGQF